MDNDLLWIIMIITTFDNHYYDEANIPTGKSIDNCRVVVNHVVELTAEEKEEARKEAMQRAIEKAYHNITQPQKKIAVKQTTEANKQPSFFDF